MKANKLAANGEQTQAYKQEAIGAVTGESDESSATPMEGRSRGEANIYRS